MLVLKNPTFRLICDKRAGCGFSFRSVRALGARSERQADDDAERTKEADAFVALEACSWSGQQDRAERLMSQRIGRPCGGCCGEIPRGRRDSLPQTSSLVLAASSRSRSVIPPAECVHQRSVTRL
jgi:hypothetical protein